MVPRDPAWGLWGDGTKILNEGEENWNFNQTVHFVYPGRAGDIVLSLHGLIFFWYVLTDGEKAWGSRRAQTEENDQLIEMFLPLVPAVRILLKLITVKVSVTAAKHGWGLVWLGLLLMNFLRLSPITDKCAVFPCRNHNSSKVYTAICWVMTLWYFSSLYGTAFLLKIQGGLLKIKTRTVKWGDIYDCHVLRHISAFGMVFSDIRIGPKGWDPLFLSCCFPCFFMGICGIH